MALPSSRRDWTLVLGMLGSSGYLVGFVVRLGSWSDPRAVGGTVGGVRAWLVLMAMCLASSLWARRGEQGQSLQARQAGPPWLRLGLAYRCTAFVGLGWIVAHAVVVELASRQTPWVEATRVGLLVGQPMGAAAASFGLTALAFHAGCSAGRLAGRVMAAYAWGLTLWLLSLEVLAQLVTGGGLWPMQPML